MPPLILLLSLACCAQPAPPAVVPPSATPPSEAPAAPKPLPLAGLPVGSFHPLEPGLELGHFASPVPSTLGDSRITVLRVDPQLFSVEVLSASREHPDTIMPGPGWAARHDLVAVINAGMFGMDYRTATFALIDQGHDNNGTIATKAGSALLLEPTDAGLPSARLLDLRCDDIQSLRPSYTSLVQSYRLLTCAGTPAWQRSHMIWSHALVGSDQRGHILFIHARSPWSTRQITEILLALPLDLQHLHYAEGGPEATLYLRHGERELLQVGSYETGFNENDHNKHAWEIPNVIAVRRKPTSR